MELNEIESQLEIMQNNLMQASKAFDEASGAVTKAEQHKAGMKSNLDMYVGAVQTLQGLIQVAKAKDAPKREVKPKSVPEETPVSAK